MKDEKRRDVALGAYESSLKIRVETLKKFIELFSQSMPEEGYKIRNSIFDQLYELDSLKERYNYVKYGHKEKQPLTLSILKRIGLIN